MIYAMSLVQGIVGRYLARYRNWRAGHQAEVILPFIA